MNYSRIFLFFKWALLGLALWGWFGLAGGPERGLDEAGGAIPLRAPAFLGVARADGESPASFLDDEAGQAVYAQADQAINFDHIRGVFRTIEAETAEYLIGSVGVPNYPEPHDAHVYAHQSGWLLAYYPQADPSGKIVDWQTYDGSAIPNKLEIVLNRVATQGQFTLSDFGYYDFRYPNAAQMMLVARQNGSFQIRLPAGFSYYEMSWAWGSYSAGYPTEVTYQLDGQTIYHYSSIGAGWRYTYGLLTEEQLIPDLLHTISILGGTYSQPNGGLILIYRE